MGETALIGNEIIMRLRKEYPRIDRPPRKDDFGTLIRTILSQNTNFKNEDSAFRKLDRLVGVKPETLANASLNDVIECIKSAGLYRNKAPRIIEVSRIILEKYGGHLSRIFEKNMNQAREELMELPGVGFKTADVLLLFEGKKAVIPVDTHIFRISARLGLVKKDAKYEKVRKTLETTFRPEDFNDAHLLLIQLGRSICTARKAECRICPLSDICPKFI